MLVRIANLTKAILAKVTCIELAAEVDRLLVEHQYQEPFGEDIAEAITNAIKVKNAGGISEETFVELNPLVRDKEREKKRIEKEQLAKDEKEAEMAKNNVFNYQ